MNHLHTSATSRCFLGLLLWGWSLVAVDRVQATGSSYPPEARSVAMGGLSAALESFRNPASFVYSPTQGRALLSIENRYGMKELTTYGAAARFHFPFLQVGAAFSRFGYEQYHQTSVGIDLSKRLFSWLGLGVRLRYTNLYRSQEEGSDEAVSADLGVTFRPSDPFTVALLGLNLVRSRLNRHTLTDPLPLTLLAGMAYQPSDRFLVGVEVEYRSDQPVRMNAGMEYIVLPQLPLRIGFTSSPMQPTFGIGYRPSAEWRFDIASSYHTILGFTPSLSVEYCF